MRLSNYLNKNIFVIFGVALFSMASFSALFQTDKVYAVLETGASVTYQYGGSTNTNNPTFYIERKSCTNGNCSTKLYNYTQNDTNGYYFHPESSSDTSFIVVPNGRQAKYGRLYPNSGGSLSSEGTAAEMSNPEVFASRFGITQTDCDPNQQYPSSSPCGDNPQGDDGSTDVDADGEDGGDPDSDGDGIPDTTDTDSGSAGSGGISSNSPTAGLEDLTPLGSDEPPAVASDSGRQCGKSESGKGEVILSFSIGCRGESFPGPYYNAIYDALLAILRFLSTGVGIIAVASLIVAGIQYSSAQGNPQVVQNAIKRASSTGGALLLYMLIYAIVNWLVPGGLLNTL